MSLGFGLISCNRSPGDPRSWEDSYREALELTERLDNAGFDWVWTTEHHFVDDGYMPSLLAMSAAMAARTVRIKVATGVLLAPLHHPLRLAEDAATVQILSGGRLLLGLGLGWSDVEFDAFGAGLRTRGKAMDEILGVLRRASAGEPQATDGDVYRLPPVIVRPVPDAPVSLLIGGSADAALQRAGRLADGFFSNAPPDKLAHQVDVIGTALAEAGRDPELFDWHYYGFVYPCDHPDQGWDEVRDYVWATSWKYSDMGPSATRQAPLPEPPPPVPEIEERLRARTFLGPGSDIAGRVAELRELAGVDFHFTARAYYAGMPFSRQAEIVDRLAEELLPAL